MTSLPTIISEFKLPHEEFDPAVARQLAELIQHAYKHIGGTPLDALQGTYNISLLGTLTVPFGFVASEISSKNVFIVFRGTIKFIEWFKDVNIQLVSYKDSTQRNERVEIPGEIAEGVIEENQSSKVINTSGDFGYVTAGFRGIYITLREQMLEALEQVTENSQIYLTGHSLGAALATLAVPDILNNPRVKVKNPKNIKLYTFASPRCGDRTFATSFEKTKVQHWRIANTEDFVTMIPFPTGNVFKPAPQETSPELDVSPESKHGLGIGGVTGVDKNPNPIFGFFKAMYDRNKRRMPDYAHTGTPVYFTIHEAALERHHNLHEVYMLGIGQKQLEL